ncbi:MAG: branched-chain amino acid ABC transporter permease, partial [Beijerinckiaceae bacterium]|nr:branched-chain amino acid ABC transporter permease [Beijerinckiaceae bacterium]
VAVLLPEWLRCSQGYSLIIYSVMVFALLAWSPTGILGLVSGYFEERRVRAASARRASAPGALHEEALS